MPEASTFALFAAAALALLLVPGPAVFYVVARSVEGGRVTGLVSVLGVELGTLVHVVFAAIGLSAVLVSSATAFTVVKWLGAAYLVYLGFQHLLARDGDEEELPAGGATRLPRVFTQSVLVQVLNPKVALFFLAFLPQFVDPSRGAAWTQVVVLGATLAVLGLFTDGIYALLGGAAGDWLKRRRSAGAGPRRVRRYVSGGIYLTLGAATAVSGSAKD
jgi:threonine/homoserine/homoserine lactone efflux protein